MTTAFAHATASGLAFARAASVFPQPGFHLAVGYIEDRIDDLLPAERGALARALPARLASYAAGRRCARRALQQLDAATGSASPRAQGAILRDPHGCPLWPAHATGSISHSPTVAVAVVAPRARARAIGVDIEALDRVAASALERVFSPSERRWLAGWSVERRERLAYAVFAAREALYKCVYQACGHSLAPEEVVLDFDVSRGLFHAEWCGAARRLTLPVRLSGRFAFDARHVLAGVWCAPLPCPVTQGEPVHECCAA